MPPNVTPGADGHIRESYAAPVLSLSMSWDAAIRWWDGVELWLTQLYLPLQFGLLMLVLLPVCWWAARVIDRAVELTFERLGRRRAAAAASDAYADALAEEAANISDTAGISDTREPG
jgi:hypothetical protein